MTHEFPPPVSELVETFDELEDWEERYGFILDLGRELPPLDESLQKEENKVHGCMSTVWLVIDAVPGNNGDEPTIAIHADSDSLIVKGLIVLLLSMYEGKTPAEAIQLDPKGLFNQLGLNQHLSPNRRNGLYSAVGRVRELCVQLATRK